jgi:catechol 2,3-dioxygenase-like lactoylglutathione lyase family enzyme
MRGRSVTRFLKSSPRLPVTNLNTTVEFYTQILGFQLANVWPHDAPSFALLERDEVCVQLSVADETRGETVGHTTICFDVSDAPAIHAALSGRVPVEWGPEVYWYGRREFAVRDPNGYLLIFSEETSNPPTCRDDA